MAVAPLAVAVPLLAAGLLTAVAVRLNRAVSEVIALAATLATVTFCVILLARTASGTEVYWFGGWETHRGIAVGVAFVVDAFGAGLAALCSVLMVAALVLMWRYRDTEPPHFQTLMLLFLTGMVGFCLSGDLFNMFVFFELMSIAAFALAGYKIDEDEAVEGSLNFAVTNTIGSFLILTGIALVYGRTGALNLAQIAHGLAAGPSDGLVVVAFCLLAAGLPSVHRREERARDLCGGEDLVRRVRGCARGSRGRASDGAHRRRVSDGAPGGRDVRAAGPHQAAAGLCDDRVCGGVPPRAGPVELRRGRGRGDLHRRGRAREGGVVRRRRDRAAPAPARVRASAPALRARPAADRRDLGARPSRCSSRPPRSRRARRCAPAARSSSGSGRVGPRRQRRTRRSPRRRGRRRRRPLSCGCRLCCLRSGLSPWG